MSRLGQSQLWKGGPDFLLDDSLFPIQTFETSLPCDDDELRREARVLSVETNSLVNPTDKLLNSSSNWDKLKFRVATLIKFKCYSQNKNYSKSFGVDDLNYAEMTIFKYEQRKSSGKEYECVLESANLPQNSSIRKLSPILIDDVLRVGGRLHFSNLTDNVKHPIILPHDSLVVKVYLYYVHSRVGHLGRESILASVRKKYYIIKANAMVRKIVRNCIICRKVQGKPLSQQMADLPSARIIGDTPAFCNVGVDYFGPFSVTNGRKVEKRYGVVFSCMSSRAIHIEMSYSLTTDAFINCLRRFISRRGNVKCIYSDNGTNFVGANLELAQSIKELNNKLTHDFLCKLSIDWHFNPPYASHFGGFYEREIRSIRKILNSLLLSHNIKLSDEHLSTLFCEIEAILNNRPLTEISSDPLDNEPLTPNHLLLFNAGITFPPGLFTSSDSCTRRRWRQIQYLVDVFWTRWRREYLVLLQERQKCCNVEDNLNIGDVVLVKDLRFPRNMWPLGLIVDVNKDRKNYVRSAKVKIYKGEQFKCNVIDRPITKLILLIKHKADL